MDKNGKSFRRHNRTGTPSGAYDPEAGPRPMAAYRQMRETEYHKPVYYPTTREDRLRSLRTALMVVLLLACVIVLLGLIRWPYRCRDRFTACTIDGETAWAETDFTVYRYLFRPSQTRGTVTWDGHVYVAVENDYNWKQTFLYIRSNLSDLRSFLLVGKRRNYGFYGYRQDMMADWLSGKGPAPVYLHLSVTVGGQYRVMVPRGEDGSLVSFYGPASTAEEARALSR